MRRLEKGRILACVCAVTVASARFREEPTAHRYIIVAACHKSVRDHPHPGCPRSHLPDILMRGITVAHLVTGGGTHSGHSFVGFCGSFESPDRRPHRETL